jgi:hypothetical protein
MTRDERLAILGPESLAEAERIGAEAPPPTAAQLALLQRVFAEPEQHGQASEAA